MVVRSELYISLLGIGIEADVAAQISNAEHCDTEAALVAIAQRLGAVMRALDKMEDNLAADMGLERRNRFAPRP